MSERAEKALSVAVIGMGYVGLPLSLLFALKGSRVVGLDIDESKPRRLNAGESYIRHIGSQRIRDALKTGRFRASSDFSQLSEVDAIVICVPTPLNHFREPDLTYVLNTGRTIARNLRRGTLVVLESTTFPGTTEEELRPILENESGMKAGQDFHLAYSPEREDPGNPGSRADRIPKLVGGYTPACLARALALYRPIVKEAVAVSDCRVAEAAKLLENIFRSVNIALVNELKTIFTAMGIDVWEVIDAASTKPFGFMPFYPGPGLGGHCIPIDPFYLAWKARAYGQHTRFIELAGEINTGMPESVIQRVSEALNANRKPINGSRILVLGLAYKPNVDDDRESPSYVLIELLQQRGAAVDFHDPLIPVIGRTREHGQLEGVRSVAWSEDVVRSYDLVIISTAHDDMNYAQLSEWATCVVDTRNAMSNHGLKGAHIWKA